ncbi:tungstate ABC transporter substrate-binding protein WtpA [Thermocladium modestius]|uniref:Tungstate ABC transporter substrate-binding protein WtpA n=1 Tax=Thermocladium modestius TaxID=62609 RepID=A0A830GVA4_9CREN|nr:substrate-binding domain-containing protein [Thermocladium modestius]GGP21924.1 tungstate ABC transporter substrate-binding protein WtpA [Thermocladium modestius]
MASKSIVLGVVLLVVGLVVGLAVGYLISPRSAKPVQTTTSSPGAFNIGAAGTLKFAFGDLLNIYKQLYPSVTTGVPLFKGSGEVMSDENATKVYSLVASADTTTIPKVLFPVNLTNYEIAFGSTQMVILVNLNTTVGKEAYNLWLQTDNSSSSPYWKQIFELLMEPGVVVGVSNPFTDPSGYQAICVTKLAGLTYFDNSSLVYDTLYYYGGQPLNPNKIYMENTEVDLVTLMESGKIDFILSAYMSNALPTHAAVPTIGIITLPDQINLGNLSMVNYYHSVNVTWTENGVTKTFQCNPVVYTASIPYAAPNSQAAINFMLLLFSPEGQSILRSNGITPILPGVVYGNYGSVPPQLKPFTVPLSDVPALSSIFPQ